MYLAGLKLSLLLNFYQIVSGQKYISIVCQGLLRYSNDDDNTIIVMTDTEIKGLGA